MRTTAARPRVVAENDRSMLIVTPHLKIPLEEFQFSFARSSGPGGQNVNKVNSKAVLRWPVQVSPSLSEEVRARFMAKYHQRITTEGDLVLSSQRFRNAPRNVEDCLEKLGQMLVEVSSPPKMRRPTKPSRGAVRRRLSNKRRQSDRKRSRGSPGDE